MTDPAFLALFVFVLLGVLCFNIHQVHKGLLDLGTSFGKRNSATEESVKNLISDVALMKKRTDDLEFQLRVFEADTERQLRELTEDQKDVLRTIKRGTKDD